MATPSQNPYVGPRPFQTGETLYGRNQELYELLDLLIAERIVLLYSPSGAGKTSLIQAGLLPRLAEEGFQARPMMRVSLEPPPDQKAALPDKYNRYVLSALLSLEEGVPEDRQLPLPELAGMTLAEYMEQRDLTPRPPLLRGEGEQELPSPSRRGAGGEFPRTVFIFDQFEEILTVDPTDHAAKIEFFVQVGALLRNRDYYALFAMREEFPAGLDPYLRHLPTRLSTTFRLELLGVNAAQEAMQEPARQAGIPFTNSAAAKMINDLRTVRVQETDGSMQERPGLYVEPVQLQVVCHRLWNHLPAGLDAIQESHLQQAGDVNTALSDYYADSVAVAAQQTGAHERAIRTWFDKHLITEQGLRGQVLRGLEESQGLANAAIAPLVNAHLVRAENRRGATWYELAHDRLIEPVRQNNAAWFETHLSTLQRQATVWNSQNRARGLLLSDDDDLEKAVQWADTHRADMTAVEGEFLDACLEVREALRKERRQNRRIRWLAIGALLLSMIVLIASGVAYFQRVAAQRLQMLSAAQVLLVQAERQSALGQDERAALLARQAYLFNQRYQGTLNHQIGDVLRTVLSVSHFTRELQSSKPIMAMALSPDDQTLATGDSEGLIQVWNLHRPGEIPLELRGHTDTVWSLAFSPDGQTLASASGDATLRLWTLASPDTAPQVLTGHAHSVFAVAVSPDGNWLASGGLDATIRLWPLRQAEPLPLALTGHQRSVNALAFSPDGNTLASGSADATIRLWNVRDLEREPERQPIVLQGHTAGINAIAFRPDGDALVSGSSDHTLRVWNLRQPEIVPAILTGHAEGVLAVAVSPDGQKVASGGWDKEVRLWNCQTPDCPSNTLGEHGNLVTSVVFSGDGQTLMSGSADQTVRLRNLTQIDPTRTVLAGHTERVNALEFSIDGELLASAGDDGSIRLWPINDINAEPVVIAAHAGHVTALALSPDGRTLASGGTDRKVRLWTLREPAKTPIVLQRSDQGRVTALAFDPPGSRLAVGSDNGHVLLWDLRQPGSIPQVLTDIDMGQVLAVQFSPDGQALVVSSTKGSALWLWNLGDLASPPQIVSGQRGVGLNLAFAPDGAMLASGTDKATITLWQGDIRLFAREQKSDLLELGQAQAGSQGSSEQQHELAGHRAPVLAVVFSPDGQTLASASADGTVRLWNPHNPQMEAGLLEHPGDVRAIAFSPDGQTLASGGDDGRIVLWRLTTVLADDVCQIVHRDFTAEEWREFSGGALPLTPTCP